MRDRLQTKKHLEEQMFSHLALEGHISFTIPQRAKRRSPHLARGRQIRRDVV